uniref:Protein kinase domain-containing protein n=2 Tax=Ditylum brightwellii TaxID=49249 RepID=A0A7S1YQ24_9STRA|mmetsp:Transcript_12983/g.19410  ORF Transcript_12983/g.19410 Transcript_12983/m.19410 type:complete len:182 (+) Transcript_12983:208-753(+)
MCCCDVLSDDKYLYSFMPFCSCGELFGFVDRDGRFSEPVARFWFRQLINGLCHLQRMGVCHRDLSLENILIDQYTKSLIIDLGMCLRVPFGDDDGNIMDVSGGTLRRLMSPQGQCGKPNYISPEVLQNTESFDGFAIDVWAAGIILFIMLVGLPPFEWTNQEYPQFRMIAKGGLMTMLTHW